MDGDIKNKESKEKIDLGNIEYLFERDTIPSTLALNEVSKHLYRDVISDLMEHVAESIKDAAIDGRKICAMTMEDEYVSVVRKKLEPLGYTLEVLKRDNLWDSVCIRWDINLEMV